MICGCRHSISTALSEHKIEHLTYRNVKLRHNEIWFAEIYIASISSIDCVGLLQPSTYITQIKPYIKKLSLLKSLEFMNNNKQAKTYFCILIKVLVIVTNPRFKAEEENIFTSMAVN